MLKNDVSNLGGINMHFYCGKCKKIYPINTLSYKCECGGLFRLYRESNEKTATGVSLGEVETPLLKANISGMDFLLKLDYLSPTGSFKDRGAFVLINQLKEMGIEEIVEDSSGNAGAAIAAYAAAAGIQCHIYLPESTSPSKIKQIKAYGADVVAVPGLRDNSSEAVREAAAHTYYASHVYNPLFFEGTKSLAHDLYEQVGGVPDYIFVPTGNGTMLLGLYHGFEEIGKLPKLIAVQSENCRPVYNAFYGLPESASTSTVAEGIAVGTPMRCDEMVTAIRNSQGDVITVSDEEVLAAGVTLGKHGVYAEVTSGATLAGALKFFSGGKPDNYSVVIPLTGIGLKK